MALEFTDANFQTEVLASDKLSVIDFWAEWCGPCRMIAPFVEEISKEYAEKAIVAKCDVDNSPGVAARFGIRNIPTVLFFKNGVVADKQIGAVPKVNFVNKLTKLLQ